MPSVSRWFCGGIAAVLAVGLAFSRAEAQGGVPIVLTGAPVILPLPPLSLAPGSAARQVLVLEGVRRSVAQPALYDLFWLSDSAAGPGQFIGTLSLFGLPAPETLPAAQGRTLVFDVTGLPLGAYPALRLVPGPGDAAGAEGRVVIDRLGLEILLN